MIVWPELRFPPINLWTLFRWREGLEVKSTKKAQFRTLPEAFEELYARSTQWR